MIGKISETIGSITTVGGRSMQVLFKNGLIYDGTGNKPYKGDILIEIQKRTA